MRNSRRPPPKEMMDLLPQDQRDRVEHIACDFLAEPEEIAKELTKKNVTADYIFFYSYAQPRPDPGKPVRSRKVVFVGARLTYQGVVKRARISEHQWWIAP